MSELERALEVLTHRALATSAYRSIGEITPESLASLPITEKRAVRAAPQNYVPGSLACSVLSFRTSGTTGTAVRVLRTRAEFRRNANAIAERLVSALGRHPDRICSTLDHNNAAAGAVVEAVAEALGASFVRMFPYRPSGPQYRTVRRTLVEERPDVVFGTPDVFVDIEAALRRLGGFEEAAASVRHILTLGATLTEGKRERLARSWDASVASATFGSTETSTIAASSCPYGSLHILRDRFALELRSDATTQPLDEGGVGELIVTPLDAEAFILVRYATGDLVDAVRCACGTDEPALRVHGRSGETVLTPRGVMGQHDVESIVFACDAVEDYSLIAGSNYRLHAVEILPFVGAEGRVDEASIAQELGADVRFVTEMSARSRAAGLIKSWRRAKVRRSEEKHDR
ncbi:MAG: phenylacetate--CoA ligase family protein [Actinomycetota bacterium]